MLAIEVWTTARLLELSRGLAASAAVRAAVRMIARVKARVDEATPLVDPALKSHLERVKKALLSRLAEKRVPRDASVADLALTVPPRFVGPCECQRLTTIHAHCWGCGAALESFAFAEDVLLETEANVAPSRMLVIVHECPKLSPLGPRM
jgi:hypothetical protein